MNEYAHSYMSNVQCVRRTIVLCNIEYVCVCVCIYVPYEILYQRFYGYMNNTIRISMATEYGDQFYLVLRECVFDGVLCICILLASIRVLQQYECVHVVCVLLLAGYPIKTKIVGIYGYIRLFVCILADNQFGFFSSLLAVFASK